MFLRLCNNLLRRLSKTSNTLFAGAISLQISALMPVDEKSAINSLGKFNRDNITVVEQAPEESVTDATKGEAESKSMEDDSGVAAAATPAAPPSLYSSVWGLQRFFVDPSTLKQPAELATFQRCASALLQSLESRPLDDKQSLSALVSANGLGVAGAAVRPSSFPKYLTGTRLLDLQLHDPLFRRSLLMQMLIFVAHLLNPAGHADTWKDLVRESNAPISGSGIQTTAGNRASDTKGAAATGTAAATSRPSGSSTGSSAPSSTAASASTASALAATNVSGAFLPVASLPPLRALFVRALHCLRSTPPAGSRLNESFLSLLARENRFWIQWKDQRCAALERPAESAQTLAATIPVEELAQAKRSSKAGGSATTAPAKDAATDASARKRKADALSSSSGPFKGFAGKSSARGASDSATASASGSQLSRAPVMGSASLARLFLPSDDRNMDVLGFLSSEDRDATPNLRFAFIQTLVDEEQEHAERVSAKEERNKRREQIERKRQEKRKAKEEAAAEGSKDDTQPAAAADASMDDGGDGSDDADSAELAELDEADAADVAADRSMLKCESRKAWQLLRLLESTAQVAPSWLSGATESMDDDAIDQAATLSGLDLAMRSEGQINKIVEFFAADRKRIANAQAQAAAAASSAASSIPAADEDQDLVAEANRLLAAQQMQKDAPMDESAAAAAPAPAVAEPESTTETDDQPSAATPTTTDAPEAAASAMTPEDADSAAVGDAGTSSVAALTPIADEELGEPATDASAAAAAADTADAADNDEAHPHKKQKQDHAAPSEPSEADAAAATGLDEGQQAQEQEQQPVLESAADASTPIDDADAPGASTDMND